jgi:hypothetical protein
MKSGVMKVSMYLTASDVANCTIESAALNGRIIQSSNGIFDDLNFPKEHL